MEQNNPRGLFTYSQRRRELALRSREVTAELGLVSLQVQKAEAALKEGAGAARDEETRVLKDHQVSTCCKDSLLSAPKKHLRLLNIRKHLLPRDSGRMTPS